MFVFKDFDFARFILAINTAEWSNVHATVRIANRMKHDKTNDYRQDYGKRRIS
jgi:hypothetical protein